VRFFGDLAVDFFAAFLFFAIELAPSLSSARFTAKLVYPRGADIRGETFRKFNHGRLTKRTGGRRLSWSLKVKLLRSLENLLLEAIILNACAD
jgi:hypothetical protein